jgi:hypothetical protein
MGANRDQVMEDLSACIDECEGDDPEEFPSFVQSLVRRVLNGELFSNLLMKGE